MNPEDIVGFAMALSRVGPKCAEQQRESLQDGAKVLLNCLTPSDQ
jgi:hypothetical protein